ncbi:hypothetical protein OTU49_003036 [Cherax quadricarinatus]|uniref:Secreted protein n=1 Tax=Cherax quadricarinatus TaxID=27406 RepID=A0AAW0Y8H6_CHEQU
MCYQPSLLHLLYSNLFHFVLLLPSPHSLKYIIKCSRSVVVTLYFVMVSMCARVMSSCYRPAVTDQLLPTSCYRPAVIDQLLLTSCYRPAVIDQLLLTSCYRPAVIDQLLLTSCY